MFGTFRLLLATLVMVDHLPGRLLPYAGNYSVFAFYLLSGYLMTLVLNETYGFSRDGVRRFLVNRALRIYPPYFAALVLAVVALVLRWWVRGAAIPPLADPGIADFVSQILLLDVPGTRVARWIIPSWSLDVEVAYYVALVFLARRRGVVLVWALLSLAYLFRQLWIGSNFIERYFTFVAASLPFSLGSALYHLRDAVPRSSPRLAIAACVAFAVNAFACQQLWREPALEGFYASLALALFAVAMLRDAGALGSTAPFRRLDARCGDLAYPLFLCHHPVVLGVAALLPLRLPSRNACVAITAVVLSFLAAWVLHRLVEVPIAAWRDRVRPAGPRATPAAAAEPSGAVPQETEERPASSRVSS